MQTPPGGGLVCTAQEADFDVSGSPVRRGVVSYYATATMLEAIDFASWVERIEQRSSADLAEGRISPLLTPMLRICGNPGTKLLGDSRGRGCRGQQPQTQ